MLMNVKMVKIGMKNFLLIFISVLSFALTAAPGDLISVTPLTVESNPNMILGARKKFCPHVATLTKAYGFKRYKVDYKTIDVQGKEVNSAGLLILPDMTGALPMYVYQHGTVFGRAELPSSNPPFREGDAMGYCFASLGYVTVLADYLGYGDGTGVHPYLHADSEATAGRDMMRASRAAVAQLKVQLNSQIFIAGYSQGGHAAMALLRLLEQDPSGEFTVTAAAPMAGPYALAETILEIIKNPSDHAAAEAVYLVKGLNPVYSFYSNLEEIVKAEHVPYVEMMFDGTQTWKDVLVKLPKVPQDLIQASYLQKIQDEPDMPFLKALHANEVYRWAPKAMIRFYHGHADLEVPYSNSETAYNYMKAKGAKVELIDLGATVDHPTGAPLAFGQAALWFESIR